MATKVMTATARNGESVAADADYTYWEKHCAPILSSLLKSTGSYSPAEEEAQLRLLSDYVLPHLGPRPSKAHTKSHLTQSGSPFQPSINFSAVKPRARYCWEPLGPHGGSESDPFAVQAGQEIISSLFKTFGFYSGWKDSFMTTFAPSPDEVQATQAKLSGWIAEQLPPGASFPPLDRVPFTFVAFELKGAGAAVKAYFNPKTKEIATGISPNEMTWNLLRNLKPALNPASLDMVADFLTNRPVPSAIELLGIDCVDEANMADARVKLYVHTRNNSFNTVRDYLTLGGRLQDKRTLDGLDALRKIWHLLLQEPEGITDDDYDKPLYSGSVFYQKAYFSFELRPNSELPEVKTYLPTWHYVRSDEETVQNYEEIFRLCGQEWGQDGRYKMVFEDAFGPVKHNRPTPVHCDASFLYSEEKGIYQTLYYSPPLEAEN
ncbi:tryptophan dimethylallyltransferase domain-containing protein [Hirsutella rhossiliensis]|uniref:Tryptophan dimethylallyltransferase domain-containing protein n=1 Tax=Hirsutella rhossiliensis TaxID=111463 RepID=A0A9P8SHF3_9HYPO|nr:tryptophan dimethylallyltransferase domain-containing protein [Hirsutella rhossiliensis]KAH0960966.1 tryptophan dimethylallyltransferase domain-containing protein [Hirsutella rhossiliensis]